MKPGRQWIALDAEFPVRRLSASLTGQFGPLGSTLYVHFLCACKRSPAPGVFRYSSETEGLSALGLAGVELRDAKGEPFTLDEFFRFLGRHKQSSTTRSGQLRNVSATHWERWQDDQRTMMERARRRRYVARKEDGGRVAGPSPPRPKNVTDSDSDRDIPPPSSSNGGTATNGVAPTADARFGPEGPPLRGGDSSPKAEPPPDLLRQCLRLVAEQRLAEVDQAAGARQREPVRNRSKWLATASEQLMAEIGDELAAAWRLTGASDAGDLVDAWHQLPKLEADAAMESTRKDLKAERSIRRVDPSMVSKLKAGLGGMGE